MSLQPVFLWVAALLVLFFLLRIFGGYAPDWLVKCRKCGRTRSAAEAGLVRIGKAGRTSLTLDWCPGCKKICWHTVVRETAK